MWVRRSGSDNKEDVSCRVLLDCGVVGRLEVAILHWSIVHCAVALGASSACSTALVLIRVSDFGVITFVAIGVGINRAARRRTNHSNEESY